MKEINTVEEIIKNNCSLEKYYREDTEKLGWEYTDVLYSFMGVYVIGLNVFYKKNFECSGLIIRPIPRNNNRQRAYSYEFIKNHYCEYHKLNELDEMKEFIKVYQTIGNIIPIWPGGNVHRGQSQCYDIPDIYFNKEKIKQYSDSFFYTFFKDNNFLDEIKKGKYSKTKVEDFLEFKEDEYKDFLKHIVNIIQNRNKLINKYLKRK